MVQHQGAMAGVCWQPYGGLKVQVALMRVACDLATKGQREESPIRLLRLGRSRQRL